MFLQRNHYAKILRKRFTEALFATQTASFLAYNLKARMIKNLTRGSVKILVD